MAKLEVALLVGAESKAWLANMESLVTRMEKAAGITPASAKIATAKKGKAAVEETEEWADEEMAADDSDETADDTESFDDGDGTDEADVDFTDEEVEDTKKKTTAKKAPAAKKLTIEMLNDAAKAYASENSVKATQKLLLEKFKAKSLQAIPEAKWPAVLKALAV